MIRLAGKGSMTGVCENIQKEQKILRKVLCEREKVGEGKRGEWRGVGMW